jgi:hypothetical protein
MTVSATKSRQIEQEPIKFEVSLGSTRIRLDMRMISVAEEQRYRQRLIDIKDDDSGAKEFRIYVDALVAFSDGVCEVLDPEQPAGFVQEKIQVVFEDQNVITERIAKYAVSVFLAKLQPDVSFL